MPLKGTRVVDLTRILAGPFATMMLADLGAEVIKVERPDGGDDTRVWGPPFVEGSSTYFYSVNRNKRSLTLDLKQPAATRLLWELVESCDVLVSNFRVGVMERLGFGYEEVARRSPRTVVGVISGYGETGPMARQPSFDVLVQAETGLMDITGAPDGAPTKSGLSLADQTAGLFLVQGILAALHERVHSDMGQKVEVALHDAMLSMFTYQAQQYLSANRKPRRLGNAHPSIVPYRSFATRDGMIVVGVGNEAMWRHFCRAIGHPELEGDERFRSNADRVLHRDELEPMLEELFAQADTEEWLEVLRRAQVPSARVAGMADALDSDLARQREMVVRLPDSDQRVLGIPVKLGRTPGSVSIRPPALGEHTEEILRELGHTSEEIERWQSSGVI